MELEARTPSLELLDAVSAVVIVLGPDGHIRKTNPAFTTVTGLAPDDLVGRTIFDLLHADEVPEVRASFGDPDPSRFPLKTVRRVVGRNGREFVLSWTTVGVFEDDGRLAYVVGTGVDVTQQHEAEHELARSRTRLDAFLEHSPAVIFMRDADSRYTMVNGRFEAISDRPRDEIIGRDPARVWTTAEADEVLAQDREVVRTGKPKEYEHMLFHGGEQRHYLSIKFPLQAPDGSPDGIGGIATDITDRVRQQERLEASYEETLIRLARAVELRDPDTGGHIERMSAYCELVARRLGFDAERSGLIRAASVMHDAGKIGIPDSILLSAHSLSVDERATMETHAKIGHELLAGSASPLLQLAASIAHSHHERYDGSGYPRGLSGSDIPLEGRIAAVADVFDAITSDRPYRPALSADAAIELMRAERGTQFDPDVLDTFLEAMPEVLTMLDSHAAGANPPDLRPLGLLPLHANELPRSDPGVRGKRIVVVEQDDEARALLTEVYERNGAHVDQATTGEQGVRAIYDVRPDLVLLDVSLPDLSGWDALTRIRDLSDVPVMMLSSSDAELEKARALRAGADDHVTKPFGVYEVLARSEALIRRRPSMSHQDDRYADPLITIDFQQASAWADGRPLSLTPLEFRLLTALVRHGGAVLSTSQLLTMAWGDARLPRDRVTVYVRYLRAKFSAVGVEPPIETLRGFGYRYAVPR